MKNKEEHDLSRGGFQNRDVGRTSYAFDFGPEYGPDFARYSDPQDVNIDDAKTRNAIFSRLREDEAIEDDAFDIFVENGFVFLSGTIPDESVKRKIETLINQVAGVQTVINLLKVRR
jgi:hypothetical protein